MKFQKTEQIDLESVLTPTQLKVVDHIADKIRNGQVQPGRIGLVIWKACQEYNIDTKPIAQALQKRGCFAKRSSSSNLSHEKQKPLPTVKDTSSGQEYIEIDVEVIHSTLKAVFVDYGGDDEKWIPKSLMEDWPDDGEIGTVMVARWFAEKEGLI